MEFLFDINQLFSERISILDQNLVASRRSTERPDLQSHIATVVDELGKASAKAQQLSAPITSASKLQSQNHQLYLLKDRESSGGRGVVVGFLKVGYKKLFLLDQHGVHVEAEPLCVLDFYVAENLQRHGYGLELFNFMLQHQNVEPVLMAYDRPSNKFLAFLGKHYYLTQSVPQVNNFVVFEGFFFNRSAVQLRRAPLKKPDGEIKPYSLVEREVVRQEQRTLPWPFAAPQSPQRSVPSQCSHSLSVGSSPSRTSSSPHENSRDQSVQLPLIERCRARRSNHQGLAARSRLYSRHMDSRTVGQLDKHLSGETPVGHQICTLSCSDRNKQSRFHTPQRSQPLRLPPLLVSVKSRSTVGRDLDSDAAEVKMMESQETSQGANRQPLLEKDGVRMQQGWLWTVELKPSSAQWVKQKQVYRSTCPW